MELMKHTPAPERLVQAAPDMLQALEWIVKELQVGNYSPTWLLTHSGACAAIAKAKAKGEPA